MDEYIKRSAFIEAVKDIPMWGSVAAMLADSIPAADVAPVTRCKDCKYSCKDENGRTCEGYWYELSEYAVPVKDDAFCSYGKPKEGAE